MTTIDDKVVAMSFESSKFEEGISRAIEALKKLEAEIRHIDTGKGLGTLSASAKEVDLSHVHTGIDNIAHKLGALRLAAIAVFADIAKHAVAAGTQMIKALTVAPLISGFHEYELQINAVQTIMANTAAAGTKLKDVNKALAELNDYADKTIYNFGEMTRNIGTFTAAGVDLKTSVSSIKGIANLAAVSGSNAEQASRAMYQLSQAIATGTVKLIDWRSVVNAGMGGSVFQRALANTATHMGTLEKGAVSFSGAMKNVKIDGQAFQASLASAGPGKESWLTSKVLTNTLKQLSGDMTRAQLVADGYTDSQIKAIQTQAKLAVDAATKVKTLTQLLSTTKEQLGTGWARTWMIIFGDFGEAKVLFTGISDALGGMIGASAKARNKLLGDWKALGGRKVLISGLKDAFHNLTAVIKPIKDAFRDIFPAVTAKQLYDLTVRFKEFTAALKPSPETVENLRRTFRGLFAALDIVRMIIGGVIGVILKLLGAIGEGSGEFLGFTASIGDWIVKLRDALKQGDRLERFFDKLGDILSVPIKAIGKLKDALSGLFGGFSSGGFSAEMSPVQKIIETISELWGKLIKSLGQAGKIFAPVIEAWVNMWQVLVTSLLEAFSHMNFDTVLQLVRTGLFAGLVLMFRQFLGKGSAIDQLTKGFGGGILKNISGVVGNIRGTMAALQGSMVALQQNIKAKTLKEIAIAVALIAASVLMISLVDPKRLSSSLTAITIAFGQLLGAMAILGNVTKTVGFIKMPVIASSLIILAGAIFALSASVMLLSLLSWESLLKGLSGVAALLGGLVVAVGPLSKSSAGMIKAGIGLMGIAAALLILSIAVQIMARMSWEQMVRGLSGFAVALTGFIFAFKLMGSGKAMMAQAAGLLILAGALNGIAIAVQIMGRMPWGTLAKGLIGFAVAIGGLVLALKLMGRNPKQLLAQAGALVILAAALNGIAVAVQIMGRMSIQQIATGLIGLGVALAMLAGALAIMGANIHGAIALGVAAAAIALLVPALVTLGSMSITQIVTGLVALAAALAIIGIAGALIAPVVLPLLGLGAALLLIGAGVALVGAGIFLIATGLSALIVAAPTGFGVLLQAVINFQKGIIQILKDTILGILEIVKAFAEVAPQFVDALVKIVNSLLDVIIEIMPKIIEIIGMLIDGIVKILDEHTAQLVQAGLDVVIALLTGIRDNIGQIVDLVVDIIEQLVQGIARNLNRIVSAGTDLVLALIRGIAGNYAKIVTTVVAIIIKFLDAITSNLPKIATAGMRIVTRLITAIANQAGKLITAGANLIIKLVTGLGKNAGKIVTAGVTAVLKFIDGLGKNTVRLARGAGQVILDFLHGLTKAVDDYEAQIIVAAAQLGVAIVRGIIQGMGDIAGELYDFAWDLAGKALDKIRDRIIPGSPSKVTYEYGKLIAQGLALGISDYRTQAVESATAMSNGVITAVEDTFEITSPSKVMKRIGKDVLAGFAEGVRDPKSQADVNKAFNQTLRGITRQLSEARRVIAAERSRLKQKGISADDRKEAKKLIKDNKEVVNNLLAGQKKLNRGLGEKGALLAQAQEYHDTAVKLEEAKTLIENLRSERASLITSTVDQFSSLPDMITKDAEGWKLDAVAAYTKSLKDQAAAVKKYRETLATLVGLGLDDTTYRHLLEQGTAGQEFADALVAGGKPAIDAISTLDADILAQSTTLANTAAVELYDAGILAAQGLANGLVGDLKRIDDAMDTISKRMIGRLKKALGIKSPSAEFAKLGVFSMEGMAKGFTDGSKVMTDSVDAAGQDALTAMQKSMRDISDVVANELDLDPTITPILDLTQVESEAQRLAMLTKVGAINAAASLGQASTISSAQMATEAEKLAAVGGAMVKFEQNNYSPTALTEIEIYRQTKNQLSKLKSALAVT